MAAKSVCTLWLKPEDYPRFREIFDDVDPTYDEWRARLERKLKAFTEQGVYVERMLIDPDELVAWCRENGREVNAEARALYPAWLLLQRDGK